jgi:ribosomal protein S12 methylthiotransferase accessory factor
MLIFKQLSMLELGKDKCIHPQKLVNYSPYQFEQGWLKGITPFNETLKSDWVKVTHLTTAKEYYVPLCFISYSKEAQQSENCFFYANSNGMAAHFNQSEAIKKAAFEVIERDSILLFWLNRISPPKIIFENAEPDFLIAIRNNLKSTHYSVELLDLTLDTVPVVMAIAISSDNSFPKYFCGVSSAETKNEAIKKALEELEFLVWNRLQDKDNLMQKVYAMTIEAVRDPVHHEMLYHKPEMASNLDFLTQGLPTYYTDKQLSEKIDLLQSLNKINAAVFYVDMTVKEVSDLAANISVVKVIIPEFMPITFGYGREALAMRRLYEVPAKLGIQKEYFLADKYVANYLPHFFA